MAQAGMSSSKAHGVIRRRRGGWGRIGRTWQERKPESVWVSDPARGASDTLGPTFCATVSSAR